MEAIVDLYNRIVREEEGQGMIEYALLAALIAVVVALGLATFGDSIVAVFTDVEASL
ncbi:MAG: Flp family type IVb pilin [Chloroflexia bacterium]|nr:Flp family type IVb pilin [Chloroflexia bacterium]